MSATKDWMMRLQERPAWKKGYEDCEACQGRRSGFNRPAHPSDDAMAYELGWADCLDEHTPRPEEP